MGVGAVSGTNMRPDLRRAATGDRAEHWTIRRRVLSILRNAYRVVAMGRNRAVGRLSGGAIGALLAAMCVGAPQTAQAQIAITGIASGTGGTGSNR